MSNDVQTHEEVAERVAGEERRAGGRHAARSLGSVTARIIGGSPVDLVNFSSRGVLFECDSRLLIGARASVRITTTDANLIVTGRVVRSRVKGLVNGALRYDAALVLDTELGLVPAIVDVPSAGPDAEFDDMVAFESDPDAGFDPSPVEAYLAESEASLLEVANGSELAMPAASMIDSPVAVAAPGIGAPEPETETAAPEPVADVAAIDEPIAFEADTEIAFEPAVEFAFDAEPSFEAAGAVGADAEQAVAAVDAIEHAAAEEPAGTSMFDATYIAPSGDVEPGRASQFVVTPPTPVHAEGTSSFFDARPSEMYGDAPIADAPASSPEMAAPEATDGVELDGEVAFEAEDAVMFEAAFDDAPVVEADSVDAPETVAASEPVAALEPVAEADADGPDASLDDLIDHAAAVPATDDRVLLQFAATVPHDLAELRRIAADNQW